MVESFGNQKVLKDTIKPDDDDDDDVLIQQMCTFIHLCCLTASYRPDHLKHTTEYYRKIIIIPKPSIFTETQTQNSF
jgi:hypothetical protein